MWNILYMTMTSLVAAVVSRTGKIIKIGLSVFERGENLLQNGMVKPIVRNRVTKLEFTQNEKLTFLEGAWHLKGKRKL